MQNNNVIVLVTVILTLTCNVALGYDPYTGRFQQQDPIGTGPRVISGPHGPQFVGLHGPTPPNPNAQTVKGIPVSHIQATVAHNPQATEAFKEAADTQQYTDGMNLYEYVASNPTLQLDPYGTNIYLNSKNNMGKPINDIFHQKVCVDKWKKEQVDGKTCYVSKPGEKECFYFGQHGFSIKPIIGNTWLGWPITKWGNCLKGIIAIDTDVADGGVESVTSVREDQEWLNYMMQKRVGLTDAYDLLRLNCRLYAQLEFRDAPGWLNISSIIVDPDDFPTEPRVKIRCDIDEVPMLGNE